MEQSSFAHLLDEASKINTQDLGSDSLRLIGVRVAQLDACNAEIARLEELLAEQKGNKKQLEQEDIPNLMSSCGLSEVKLQDGRKVTVGPQVSASIKDMGEFVAYLSERGEDGIVKTVANMGKVPTDILRSVRKVVYEATGIVLEFEQSIHSATLKKWAREVTGLAEGVEQSRINIQDLPPCLSVWTYNTTKVK